MIKRPGIEGFVGQIFAMPKRGRGSEPAAAAMPKRGRGAAAASESAPWKEHVMMKAKMFDIEHDQHPVADVAQAFGVDGPGGLHPALRTAIVETLAKSNSPAVLANLSNVNFPHAETTVPMVLPVDALFLVKPEEGWPILIEWTHCRPC